MTVTNQMKVANFQPSKQGFKFVNRFPGFPLPKAFETVIDTSRSVHGLCGGMCFGVIDYATNHMTPPEVNNIPEQGTPLYKYLAERQLASWGRMNVMVLQYIRWMAFSDDHAQEKTLESWLALRRKLADGELGVIGLIYTDFTESLRVWDNHQVLAYGYEEMHDGSAKVLLYDPNYPENDEISLHLKPGIVGKGSLGMNAAQFKGDKQIHNVHGFLNVPYEPQKPPRFDED